MIKGLIASVVLVGLATQVASAETVYIYDNSSKTAKMVNDIPVWKDAATAQSSSRDFYSKNVGHIRCLAKPPVGGELKQKVGKAFEVRVHGRCTGFVNAVYVHAEK
ncbi:MULTISPECIES: hypothetical protein [Phyllobacteriaceae]|jgi:hypothetical protein|uniref:SH3b domain-containing protein n=1 Tax=Mesorhizobium hungaricum TaxID=1566387 RepID=A0A1C2DEP8_9HYPH|nr:MULTISPECIES: hypothetical protein [Mesorhizobium]MBN9232645.1 hypothetical protein [Mesorhizobium sp.]MDQ0330242.1 hypothetical protein [Mesorhizobium sp. YL-MeA3-2017]OCX13242.1 hypothetical protein QV13_27380 [Mesorhizobium hungaricum]